MNFIYTDNDIVIAVKPPRVLSTDEAGGMPELVRDALGDKNADVRTVHRLDRVVGGLMLLARGSENASALGRQVQNGSFHKQYLAVVHGATDDSGDMTDLLYRDKARKMTFVAAAPVKGAQEAHLSYKTLDRRDGMSLVKIDLHTGRTHQIRVQFSSRGFPLVGERKYAEGEDECELALWSYSLSFEHPKTGEHMDFCLTPPTEYPWSKFNIV